MTLDQQGILARIQSELDPLAASVPYDEEIPADKDISIDCVDASDVRGLPSEIRWEIERSQARTCQG